MLFLVTHKRIQKRILKSNRNKILPTGSHIFHHHSKHHEHRIDSRKSNFAEKVIIFTNTCSKFTYTWKCIIERHNFRQKISNLLKANKIQLNAQNNKFHFV